MRQVKDGLSPAPPAEEGGEHAALFIKGMLNLPDHSHSIVAGGLLDTS